MKAKLTLLFLPAALCLAQENAGPRNELAFGLSGTPLFTRSDSPSLDVGPGVDFQVNYDRRFLSGKKWALYGEINFVADPNSQITSSVTTATHDYASLYVTPAIRVKFRPSSRISPYAAVGRRYADYEQSVKQIDGQPNQAPRELARGVFDFGTGVDVRVWRFVAEARDFYTRFAIAKISGGQNNSSLPAHLFFGGAEDK